MRGNPAAGVLLIIAGIVGFLALVSGNLDKWLNKATQSTGSTAAAGSGAPAFSSSSAPSTGSTVQSALAGGRGSSSSAAANPSFGIDSGARVR
jgi:hypothetical protein